MLTSIEANIVSLNDQSQKKIKFPGWYDVHRSLNIKKDVPHLFVVVRMYLIDFRYEAS